MGKVSRILRLGWRGIEVWDALLALGVTPMLRVALKSLVGEWVWWEQLLLFGGIFLVLLGLFALTSPLIQDILSISLKQKN